MRKGCLSVICTKAPYGLASVLEIDPGKGQEQNLREPPTLQGRVEEEPRTRYLGVVRDLRKTEFSCSEIYLTK